MGLLGTTVVATAYSQNISNDDIIYGRQIRSTKSKYCGTIFLT